MQTCKVKADKTALGFVLLQTVCKGESLNSTLVYICKCKCLFRHVVEDSVLRYDVIFSEL